MPQTLRRPSVPFSFTGYLQSDSTKLGLSAGFVMYLSYAVIGGAFGNLGLIALSLFVGGFIPYFSRLSNKADETIAFRTALVTPGRVVRFAFQFAFNLFIFATLIFSGILSRSLMTGLGGILGTAAFTTASSQGIQYLALSLASRDMGNKNRNILIALTLNMTFAALAVFGLGAAREAFVIFSFAMGIGFFGMGLASDLRSCIYPNGGIGIFFGTFNPLHKTHIELIRRSIEDRGLVKVYLHATVVPKLHRDALRRGEIKIARHEFGMRVYEKTDWADVHVNYFPTGNRFFEYETRVRLARMAIEEAGLSEMVEVLELPDVYTARGFYGVLDEIKKLNPGVSLHGIHGSDLGGMWVRSIYDESGWIYPVSFRRIDSVSATAIRNGACGMTTPRVERELELLRAAGDSAAVSSKGKRGFSKNA